MEWLNQAAEIVLRNLAWTGGWVVAAVLVFLLVVAVLGGGKGIRDQASGISQTRETRKSAQRKPSDLISGRSCSVSRGAIRGAECPRCARRDESETIDRRIRELEKVVDSCGPGEVHEPRRSRRVGPPNPRAGEPATGRRIDRVA